MQIMRTPILKKAALLLLIELVVPGGTLIVFTILLRDFGLPIPERFTAAFRALKLLRRAR